MEEKLVITGERRLSGEITTAGAKNSVLKQMAAALLLPGTVCLRNVPSLNDVYSMIEILEFLGAKVKFKNNFLEIDSADISGSFAPHELVNKSRASFNVIGPLLARFHEARVALPGGCQIGARRLDLHEKGLKLLGANIKLDQGYMIAQATKLRGTKIYLDLPSNGATENIMVASVLAEGETVIENTACDPEIADLANFLNAMGANIQGAGTHQITIKGISQKDLKSIEYIPIPDRLEACTYLIGAISTGGDITINNVEPEHIKAATSKLEEIGVEISYPKPNTLYAKANGRRFNSLNISTGWFPGFPTDLQPIITVPLTIAGGTSTIKENIYDDRFGHTNELIRLGADIKINNNVAVIKGVESLSGTKIVAEDIRGGAGLVIAGLIASGTTEITGLDHIDRGYEHIVQKFNLLGAKIKRTKSVSVESTEKELKTKSPKTVN
ncbi:MAG: UDP-N-acetylglucosamine 1-carboxyvinyltransferase [Candidatus Melainabacteria bacterium]|nr:UDP-N-acetylglucosamine 1-carboxyvinyltransferase [Candidatus Melainabacteria bacterium]MBI3308247.1 UDP-N-acetylglucosamine 1-carboxyvinyltransferase [Candidatus Melainabacteria bacterium]